MKPFLIQAALCAAALAAPAAAQELSDSELTQRLIAQREAMRALETDPELGAARGLVLNNVDPTQEAEPGKMPPPVAAGEPSAAAVAAATEEGAGAAASPTVYVDMPNPSDVFVQVTFAFDSAALAEDQKPQLRQICNVLDAAGVGTLRIVGHTDAAGPARYNQRLSVLRAEEVQRFFVNDCGIAPDRLQAIGVGEQFPFDDTDPYADGNRRVEFQAIS
jgi:outer membrane protein OmpA-like peptidoglycan-associated protein